MFLAFCLVLFGFICLHYFVDNSREYTLFVLWFWSINFFHILKHILLVILLLNAHLLNHSKLFCFSVSLCNSQCLLFFLLFLIKFFLLDSLLFFFDFIFFFCQESHMIGVLFFNIFCKQPRCRIKLFFFSFQFFNSLLSFLKFLLFLFLF